MQLKNAFFMDLGVSKKYLYLIAAVLVLFLSAIVAPLAIAKQSTQPFEATITGSFQIAGDVGNSVLFTVTESGSGTEATLGEFTIEASVIQNLARIPAGCGPNSSTGVDGTAVLTFADGTISLKRTAGTACFSFPFIHLEEQWVVAGGTGSFVGASGKLLRQADGNVLSGSFVGTISGTIKLD